MFNDSGRKIQSLALVIFFFMAAMSIVFGGYMIFICFTEDLGKLGLPLLMSGIFSIIFGLLFAWMFGIVLYGWGELINDTKEIKSITKDIYNELHEKKKDGK